MTPRIPGLGRWLMADDAQACLARCEKHNVPVIIRRLHLGPVGCPPGAPDYGRIDDISPTQLRQETPNVRRHTKT